MNFSDTEGVYTHTFEAERNVSVCIICALSYTVFFITHTHTLLTALFLELPGWTSNRKVKLIWILLKQETVSGSGTSLHLTPDR